MNKMRQRFIDKTARKPYGKFGKQYKKPTGHYKSFRIILEKLELTRDDIYLEIGCGGGALLKMALDIVKHASAIDHSKEMVELSKEINSEALSDGRVEIEEGNAESLPWRDNTFTCAASANMFFFVENPDELLSEVHRVLSSGGRFVIITAKRSIFTRFMFWVFQLRLYTDTEMRSMLEKAGFERVEIESKGIIAMQTMQICTGYKSG